MSPNKYERYTLRNGIEVVVYPIKEIRSVSIRLGIAAGSANEKESRVGTLHFLEHVMFQGCKKYPTEKLVNLKSERLGIRNNAWVSPTNTNYWFKGPDYNLTKILEFITDFITSPIFSQKAIENSRNVILTEQRDFWDRPENVFYEKSKEIMLGKNHIYTKRSFGTEAVVKKMTRNKLKQCYNKYYSPTNFKIAVSGNIDTSKAKNILEKTIGSWNKKGNKIIITKPKTLKYKPNLFIYNQPRNQVIVSLQFPLKGYKEDRSLKSRLMINRVSFLLGGGLTSPLRTIIRDELGLVYSVGTTWGRHPFSGDFEIYGITNSGNIKKTLSEIIKIIIKAKTRGFKLTDHKRANNFINAGDLMSFSDPDEITNKILRDMLDDDRIYLPEDYIKKSNTIILEDVNKKACQILNFNKAYLSLMGDKKLIEKFGVQDLFKKATS